MSLAHLINIFINTLSLLGLVLAIGIVVDDAIVVVEAVTAKMEKGLPADEATIEAMREVCLGGPGHYLGVGEWLFHNMENVNKNIHKHYNNQVNAKICFVNPSV